MLTEGGVPQGYVSTDFPRAERPLAAGRDVALYPVRR